MQLTIEQKALEIAHNAASIENQKSNQEFQQQAVKNQTRYAQITGGIAELKRLLKQQGDNNHDDSIQPFNISDRIAHVCAGEQPESR